MTRNEATWNLSPILREYFSGQRFSCVLRNHASRTGLKNRWLAESAFKVRVRMVKTRWLIAGIQGHVWSVSGTFAVLLMGIFEKRFGSRGWLCSAFNGRSGRCVLARLLNRPDVERIFPLPGSGLLCLWLYRWSLLGIRVHWKDLRWVCFL